MDTDSVDRCKISKTDLHILRTRRSLILQIAIMMRDSLYTSNLLHFKADTQDSQITDYIVHFGNVLF